MGPNPGLEAADYFRRKAEEMHTFAVHDALRDMWLRLGQVEAALASERAKQYLRYAVGRRLGMIWNSYRELAFDFVALDRTQPLPHNDLSTVDRDLNTIYINIVGVLDNYAWCLLYEITPDRVAQLKPAQVGLFSSVILKDSNFDALKVSLDQQSKWHQDLKARRDPAAHRFPLYVPPCGLNTEQQFQYRALEEQISEARINLKFDLCEELGHQQEKIGQFVSCFIHDFNEPPIPIYPTVPQDIAQLVRIGESIHHFLKARSGLQ